MLGEQSQRTRGEPSLRPLLLPPCPALPRGLAHALPPAGVKLGHRQRVEPSPPPPAAGNRKKVTPPKLDPRDAFGGHVKARSCCRGGDLSHSFRLPCASAL